MTKKRQVLVALIIVGIITAITLRVYKAPEPDYTAIWDYYCTEVLGGTEEICEEEYVVELRRPLRFCHEYAWAPFQHVVDYYTRVTFCLDSW